MALPAGRVLLPPIIAGGLGFRVSRFWIRAYVLGCVRFRVQVLK